VSVYNAGGNLLSSATTDVSGGYAIAGLAPASYFARTANSMGYIDEVYQDRPCCTVTAGTRSSSATASRPPSTSPSTAGATSRDG